MPPVDRSFLDDEDVAAESNRPGSRIAAFVLGLALIAMLAFLCLAGIYFYSQWPDFVEDPAAASELAQQLLPMEIPGVFEPRGTITWRIWPLMTMRGAYFEHSLGDGELTLLQVNSAYMSQQGFREHIIKSLQEQGAGSGFDLAVSESSSRTIDVYGRPVTFHFTAGEDRTTGAQRRLLDGIVEGPDGPVLLSLWVGEADWSEEQVLGMLESIGHRATDDSVQRE